MASRAEQLYDIYIRTYGKVQSGGKLGNGDYGTMTSRGFDPFPVDGKAAVGMAAQDVKLKAPMRSRRDFLEQLRGLMEDTTSPALPEPATGSNPMRSLTEPPTKMIGDWREIRPLARGGQGDVLLVERMPPKEPAIGVLKRVPANLADDQKRLGRLKHEIETVRGLKHPFIADLLDFNFSELWFVTRHAVLGSLADHLPLFKGDAWRTLRMGRDIATALSVAHEQSVIHRDVKPGNILLYNPDHVALTDFGIAHDPEQTEVTASSERVGAFWFRPPEADHGRHEPAPAFDIYMLGKVIYVALTGGKRFVRERFSDGDANIVTMFGRAEFACINRLLGKMIIEDPPQRFQSMREVIAGIDLALTRLFGRRSGEDEPQLVFMFGAPSGDRYSGDHPGLQMVPVWMPPTSRLFVDIRLYPGVTEAHFAVEFWADGVKIIDSGRLQAGRNEIAVQPGSSGCWTSLRVRGDNNWGSANISNLVVHAVRCEV